EKDDNSLFVVSHCRNICGHKSKDGEQEARRWSSQGDAEFGAWILRVGFETSKTTKRVKHDLFNFNSFCFGHQSMGEFMSKNGKEETSRGDYSKEPGTEWCMRWN